MSSGSFKTPTPTTLRFATPPVTQPKLETEVGGGQTIIPPETAGQTLIPSPELPEIPMGKMMAVRYNQDGKAVRQLIPGSEIVKRLSLSDVAFKLAAAESMAQMPRNIYEDIKEIKNLDELFHHIQRYENEEISASQALLDLDSSYLESIDHKIALDCILGKTLPNIAFSTLTAIILGLFLGQAFWVLIGVGLCVEAIIEVAKARKFYEEYYNDQNRYRNGLSKLLSSDVVANIVKGEKSFLEDKRKRLLPNLKLLHDLVGQKFQDPMFYERPQIRDIWKA